VEDLDVSDNLFCHDGVRKLARYIKDTRSLRKLNCAGLPVDLDGSQLIVQAVVQNDTLEQAAVPLGPCDENVERHQMFQQFGLGLQGHQHLVAIATNKPGGVEWSNLTQLRTGQAREFPPQRSNNWPSAQMATYMWMMAAVKPPVEKFAFQGGGASPSREYPNCIGTPVELWPIVPTLVHDLSRTLTTVSVAVGTPSNRDAIGQSRVMELMRVLTRCTALRSLNLLAYASAVLKESQLPEGWTSIGSAPRWLMDDKMRRYRVHWQALYGLLSTTTLAGLENFNDIDVASMRDRPEFTCLLLLQCLEGLAVQLSMEPTPTGEAGTMETKMMKSADVDAFCDVLRLLGRQPLLVALTCTDKSTEVVKAQQAKLAGPLSGVPAGENVPAFNHSVVLRNNQVSEVLLKSLDCRAPLREFCYENITMTLPALWAALCGREKPLPVEKIKVEPKWIHSSLARKRFTEQQRQLLEGVQASLIRSDAFQLVQSAGRGEVTREEIETMSPQDFADLLSGYSVDEPPEQEKYHPRVPWRCYPSFRKFVQIEEGDEPMFVPFPLDEEAAGELQLQKLSFCMCDLRSRLLKQARPDEWPASSQPIWHGPQRHVRPGDWDEFECKPVAEDDDREDGAEDADERPLRYHWRPASVFKIGTKKATAMVEQVMNASEPTFADTLLHEGLRSLLSDTSSLKSLDLRGNGLTREDANLLLNLIEDQETTLLRLNLIPVTVEEAQSTRELVIDGTGINKDIQENEDEDIEDPEGEAFAREALEAEIVRMDEGDGFIFLSLVSPQWFSELVRVELKRLEIPQDATLAHITDALLNLPSIRELHLSQLKLSGRGASLLLQAVAEMAPKLDILNGLPLARLVARRDGADSNTMELPSDIEWNDFPLGAMARLSLWPAASLPSSMVHGIGFNLQGQHLTDVGLRGLCVMLRHFAGLAQASGTAASMRSTPSSMALQLTRIDLSGNPQITDDTVGDLCHTLQHPSMGASLRHSLRDLSVRSCMRLKSRSALELQSFVMHIRDAGRGGDSGALQTINGVDLEALQNVGRSGAGVGGGRAAGLPMVLRTHVEPFTIDRGHPRPKLAALSECDALFFASMLHLWPHISYCHVHIILPIDLNAESHSSQGAFLTWGRSDEPSDEGLFGGPMIVTNDSPYPPPQSSAKQVCGSIQSHLDAAKRLFEACPFSTQLRVSLSPAVPGCADVLLDGDHRVLGLLPSSNASTDRQGEPSSFMQVKQRLQVKAQARRRVEAARRGQRLAQDAPPPRPLYVNNINSQRLHCCYRTLYGKDEVDIEHKDIMPDERCSVSLPSEVDISQVFSVASSVDLQHLELGSLHLAKLGQVKEMPVLTHVNLNHNHLGDVGVEFLFKALVDASASVVHVAVAENNIGDEGATTIAVSLGSLPRLTSLELCDNFIQERGSIAIAEAIGGLAMSPEEAEGEEPAPMVPLPVLSVDLKGNRSRELGARRWAEVICNHPDLKFLCLAQNELGMLTKENFLDLVCAAVASAALSVLDLQDNFPLAEAGKVGKSMGPPPKEVIEELLADLPAGEFDPAEVRRAVFIRRHRGGGGGGAEKKGRQPQQGQQQAGGSSRHPGGTGGGTGGGPPVPPSPAASLAPSSVGP